MSGREGIACGEPAAVPPESKHEAHDALRRTRATGLGTIVVILAASS